MAGDQKPASVTGLKGEADKTAKPSLAEAKARFREAVDTTTMVTDIIKDYPLTSVAVAAGAGFVMADSPLTRMLAGRLTKHVFKDALRAFREFRRASREASAREQAATHPAGEPHPDPISPPGSTSQ